MLTRTLFPALLLTASLAVHCQSIPAATLQALDGHTTVTFPADLHGKPAVLILGFSKKSFAETLPWFRFAEQEFGHAVGSDSRVLIYQLPVLASVPSMFRGFVLRGMRSGVPSATQARMFPVLADEQVWKGFAHFSASDDAYVVVLDANSNVAWRASGALTEDQSRALSAKVHQLEASPPVR